MTTKEKIYPNKTARIAGFLYLIIFPLNIFAMMYVPSNLIVPESYRCLPAPAMNCAPPLPISPA